MKSPKGFKYSPNGFTVLQVAEGEEMCEAAAQAAIDLKIIKKADLAKAAQEAAEKSTGPDANKATGPDSNKAG